MFQNKKDHHRFHQETRVLSIIVALHSHRCPKMFNQHAIGKSGKTLFSSVCKRDLMHMRTNTSLLKKGEYS